MARVRQTTTPSTSSSTPSTPAAAPKGKKVVSKTKEVITDEPLVEKKPAARKVAVKDGNKEYKVADGSVVRQEGPDIAELPIAKEIYTLTFPATSPVGAAKKAFAKIYKSASPSKKGMNVSDKPNAIVYNLVIVDIASGKHFPYVAHHIRRETPSVVKKGDGVIQWELDGVTRKKNWTSAQAAGDALGGEVCSSVEDLQKAHPGFKWTPSVFTSHFETNVKAFKSAQGAQGAQGAQSSQSQPGSSTDPVEEAAPVSESVPRKKIPQGPRKPVQTVNVPAESTPSSATESSSEEKQKPPAKGRRNVKTVEPAKPPAKDEAVKPPAKGRAKAK